MKYLVFLPLVAVLMTGCASANQPAVEPTAFSITTNKQVWDLAWSDEFNAKGLPDPAKWDYEEGFIRNNELQFYTSARQENARVEDGMLIIEARKESFKEAGYTSASLITKNKQTFINGRIEVRAKIPTGKGMWPAIWMLGANIDEIGWPDCGEIDIMENVGFDPDMIYGTVHTGRYNHVNGTAKGSSMYLRHPYEDFHLYAIEWFTDHIDFYLDEYLYFTFENDGKGSASWPFDQPHYLILNIAVGGAWGGMQGVDDSVFPQQMQIDYVRVFKAHP